jgi:ribonuclease HI
MKIFDTKPDLIIQTDGGARNNPGHAGIGAVFINPATGDNIRLLSKYIGKTTNNIAEYVAMIESLRTAKSMSFKKLKIQSDSELVVKQMKGEYKVKDDNLKILHQEVKKLVKEFDFVIFEHIRREKNKEADSLVNESIDTYLNELKS